MLTPHLRLNILPPHQTALQAGLWACAGSLGLVFAYSCSCNLLLFAPSIYLLQIYDRVLSSRSGHTLLMLTVIVAFAVVLGGVLDALRRAVLGRLGAWLEDRLRPFVLSACLENAYRGNSARATEVYRDLTALRQFIESNACPMLFDALWTPLFLGVLFLVDPLLGVIGACSALVLFGLTLTGDLLTEDAVAKSGAALSRSYGRFAAAVDNVHLIRTMGMFEGTARRIYQDARDALSEHNIVQRRYEIIMLATKPTRALAQVLMMGAAAWLVLDHGKSPAIIFVTTLMFGRALAPVEGAISGWKSLSMALKACQRLGDALAAVPAAAEKTDPPSQRPTGNLIVDNVGLKLAGNGPFLLKGVSFNLSPGECLGIIGPSGSGKSMLGQIIAGVSAPTHGRVLLDSMDVSNLRGRPDGRHIGYLPQDINLFGETMKEIIARLDDIDLQKVMKAATLAGIHEAIMRLPQGYDTVVRNDGFGFSRGYRQRLGLARAFYGDPRILVLDEPNASLDYVGERVLLDAIEQMKIANTTVIIITHRMGILAAADSIAIMQAGAVAAFGESEEVFQRYLSTPQVVSRVEEPENGPERVVP
jgi:PrtD family type I secretion system ABC transporter